MHAYAEHLNILNTENSYTLCPWRTLVNKAVYALHLTVTYWVEIYWSPSEYTNCCMLDIESPS